MGYILYPKELRLLYNAVMSCAGQTYATVAEPIQVNSLQFVVYYYYYNFQWACVKLFDFGPDILEYNKHCRRILTTVAKYAHEELVNCDVIVKPAFATFYLFPNFECCRQKLKRKGIITGQEFCDLLFDEKKVAVS